ncbi:MAG: DUF1214 domain-containing protein [Dehalococcoidia bacterium]|nr:DUF1214 domain-containing protein [Dehalococcoidia bacterium]
MTDIKTIYKVLIAAVIALVAGAAIGFVTVNPIADLVTSGSNIKNGPWSTNLAYGSTGANPYVKAWVAENGLMAVSASLSIYLDAYTDDNGQPLVANCDYVIQGPAPKSGYWNITVYNENGFLIANDENRYSFSSTDIQFEPDGTFKIYLSGTQKQGNWLPTGNATKLNLYLRLHDSGTAYSTAGALKAAQLPNIVKEGCQ